MKKIPRLLFSILLCQAAGIIGSIFTIPQVNTWYKTLVRPSFAPPSWIFGPVWTMIYTLMGIALFLIWFVPAKTLPMQTKNRSRGLTAFFIQLILNAIWSPIFFGLHAIGAAFVVIILLFVAIIATMFLFYKIRPAAAYLFVPYILWVGFASILNAALWRLN